MPMTQADFERDEPSGGGALSAMRDAAYSGQPMRDSMDYLLGQQVIDPSAKWNAYAGAALKPTWGGFGESMSNALGALSAGQQHEAELKAKYIPLVAQAMLQRQLQMTALAQQQWRINQEMDQAGTGALTGLLAKPGKITSMDVVGALGSAVERGQITRDKAIALYRSLPVGDSDATRQAITQLSISRDTPTAAREAVTPKVQLTDTGTALVPTNVQPNAGPVGIGPMANATGILKGLTPEQQLPHVDTEPGTGNVRLTNRTTGQVSYALPIGRFGVPGGQEVPGVAPPGQAPANPVASIRPPTLTTRDRAAQDEAAGKAFAEETGKLNTRVNAMRDVQQRMAEMRDLVKDYRPGAAAEYRAKLGSWISDISQSLGLSPEAAKNLAEKFSGSQGDFSNAQAFQKLAVQGAMEALVASMSGQGRLTQGEFGVFKQNSPSLAMDPDAMNKMLNFITRQYQLLSTEQLERNAWRGNTNNDLQGFDAYWNNRAKELGFVTPEETSGKGSALGATGAPKTYVTDRDKNGTPIFREKNSKVWYYGVPPTK